MNYFLKFILFSLLYHSFVLSFGQTKRFLNRVDFPEDKIQKKQIIVKYKNGFAPSPLFGLVKPLVESKKNQKKSILDNTYTIILRNDQNIIDECNKYLENPNVIYAEPVRTFQPLHTPNDPKAGSQYFHKLINTFKAWDITKGNNDIVIGIIDTGTDFKHEDIKENLWINEDDPIDGIDNDKNGYVDDYYGYDFADKDNDPTVGDNPHGMRVAGIAGAIVDNAKGIAGVAYNVKIASLKGFTTKTTSGIGLYEAIKYGADNNFDILNLSWGNVVTPLQSEQDIINYAVNEKNVVLIAAAGNYGNEEKLYPASYDNVLSVGATTSDEGKWTSSTYNYKVDLVAPGANILSSISNNEYGSDSGTSYAAPIVSGVAALVKSKYPNLNATQIMERIRVTCDEIYSKKNNEKFKYKMGFGRLNAYNAVTKSAVKSVRTDSVNFKANYSELIFPNDTVKFSVRIKNYLGNTSNLKIKIKSPFNEFKPIDSLINIGNLYTNSSKIIEFKILVNEKIIPNQKIALELAYEDGIYKDFEIIELQAAPDFINFGNETIRFPIASNGNLGFPKEKLINGDGFVSHKQNIMKYSGLVIATSKNSVSDNIISDYNKKLRNQDFTEKINISFSNYSYSDDYCHSTFDDKSNKIVVEQSGYSWKNKKYIIQKYRLINSSEDTIKNLYAGIFTDWDLDYLTKCQALIDEDSFAYVQNTDKNLFATAKIISNQNINLSCIDISNQNENASDLAEKKLTDSLKFEFLSNNTFKSAGEKGTGNDVAIIQNILIPTIPPKNGETFFVVWSIDSTLIKLKENLNNANLTINQLKNNPIVSETFYSCKGSNAVINPKKGLKFAFYKDANRENFISENEEIIINNLQKDTSIFVSKIDSGYYEKITKINLKIDNKFAKFNLLEDTIYINENFAKIQLKDESLNATKWKWTFGNGSATTLQNPTIVYTKPNKYEIKLIVENKFGCLDSLKKNIYVFERPEKLKLTSNYILCPSEKLILTDDSAEKLNLYSDETSKFPILSGKKIEIQPTQNTTYFLSGYYNNLESNRLKINVIIKDFEVNFQLIPDTISTDYKVNLIPQNPTNSKISWVVNNKEFGEINTLNLDTKSKDLNVRMTAKHPDGCEKIISRIITLNPSNRPRVSEQNQCNNEPVLIQPTNGKYFAFFEDEKLEKLIKKGSFLRTNQYGKIFVVGLDDGLPSEPVLVNINKNQFDIKIKYDTLFENGHIQALLTTSLNSDTQSMKWFLDTELIGIEDSLKLFLKNDTSIIVLQAINKIGCTFSDTLKLIKPIPKVPPLGISNNSLIIHPNPTNGVVYLENHKLYENFEVYDILGHKIRQIYQPPNKIILTDLKSGTYLIRVKNKNGNILNKKLIISHLK